MAAENCGKLGLSLLDAGNVVVCDAHGDGGTGALGAGCGEAAGGAAALAGRLVAGGSPGGVLDVSIGSRRCLRTQDSSFGMV